jgi:hypothetical protein
MIHAPVEASKSIKDAVLIFPGLPWTLLLSLRRFAVTRDTSKCPDILGSFLGGDRKKLTLKNLLGD